MAVSVLQYAQISNHVYRDSNQQIPGFSAVEWDSDQSSGFYAGIYCSQKGRDVVISYRGSDDLIQDWAGADLTLLMRNPPINQVHRAIEFFSYVMRNWGQEGNVSVTGHSLGGALAQMICAMNSTRGVTFNAPGMRQQLAKYLAAKSKRPPQNSDVPVINYRLLMDPVSQVAGEHVGQVRTVSDAPPSVGRHGLTDAASGVIATGLSHTLPEMINYLSKQAWAQRSPFEESLCPAPSMPAAMAY